MTSNVAVLIAVATPDQSRYSMFYDAIYQLDRPAGSKIACFRSPHMARARNDALQMMLDGDYTHTLFIDDDHVFPQDVLTKLLVHNLDMVSATYVQKAWPYQHVVMRDFTAEGMGMPFEVQHGMQGLWKVAGCGMGCCLIKRSVVEQLGPKPWFVMGDPIADLCSEDFTFCRKVRSHHIDIHVDLDICLGHFVQLAMWPHYDNKHKWQTAVATPGRTMFFPSAVDLVKMERKDAN